jgi:membrane protein
VFDQLQDALNTIWGVKPKPGGGLVGFVRTRFLSFAMVGGVCFLLLVSLTVETLLRGLSEYLKHAMPGGDVLALALFLIFDLAVVILLYAMIFRYLPDAKIAWRDMWVGATPRFFSPWGSLSLASTLEVERRALRTVQPVR